MKFCEKLAKQRKNNNLSQEQLAEMLSVSRQAVSKWENGSSYPDMDKIISISKILNCTLEDLLDDGVIKHDSQPEEPQKRHSWIHDWFQSFLNFTEKTYNMFCRLTWKGKVRCLFELLLIGLFLVAIGAIVYSISDWVLYKIFSFLPYSFRHYFVNILGSIIFFAIVLIGIIIFIRLFKMRYLDYMEDVDMKSSESSDETIDGLVSRPRIIIRDSKKEYSFFGPITKFITWIMRICAFFFFLLFAFFLVCSVLFDVILFYHSIYSMASFFFGLAILGIIMLLFACMHFLYQFIFVLAIGFRKLFLVAMAGLVLIGVGSGLGITVLLTYDEKTSLTEDEYVTSTFTTVLEDDVSWIDTPFNVPLDYVIDPTLGDREIKVEVQLASFLEYDTDTFGHVCPDTENDNSDHLCNSFIIYYKGLSFYEAYHLFLESLQNHTIWAVNRDQWMKVTITCNQETFDSLSYSN